MRGICLVLSTAALGCSHAPSVATVASQQPTAPLSRDEIVAGMQGALHRIRQCPSDPPGSPPPTVRVQVGTNGRVSEVLTMDLTSGTPAASCREQAIRLVVFRANPGTGFDYIFPLR